MKVALAQIEVVVGNKEETLGRIVDLIKQAGTAKADLVIFPEFCNTEYFCIHWDFKYLEYAEPLTGRTISTVTRLAERFKINIILPIYLDEGPGIKYNAAVVIENTGDIKGVYRKAHPAARLSLEKIFFKPGSRFPIFHLGDWKVGILICYDTYFPEAARILALKGAELIVLPFAEQQRMPLWTSLLPTRAYENGCYVAALNRVGREPGPEWNIFEGGSLIADPFGQIFLEAGNKPGLVISEIDRRVVYKRRSQMPEWFERRPELYGALTNCEEEVRGERE